MCNRFGFGRTCVAHLSPLASAEFDFTVPDILHIEFRVVERRMLAACPRELVVIGNSIEGRGAVRGDLRQFCSVRLGTLLSTIH